MLLAHSEGALHKLWAKALAIESGPGLRIVIVSTDVVGIPRSIADDVAARAEKEYGIKRSQLLLNASHKGLYLSTSPDMVHWSKPALGITVNQMLQREPEGNWSYTCFSLIDPHSRDANFSTVGDMALLVLRAYG
jgi:hypothetical protein